MTNENSKRKELDYRFADEMDGIDIHKFIHLVVKNVEQNESSPFYFRNKDSDSIITIEELDKDLSSMPIKWLILETPAPEEDIVAVARLSCENKSNGRVDMLYIAVASTVSDQIYKSIMKRMVSVLETVSYNMGLHSVIIEVPEWRTDIQEVLTSCKYMEESGYTWPVNKLDQIIKSTMILEYHKRFESNTDSIHQSIEGISIHNSSTNNNSSSTSSNELPQLIETLFSALHKEYDDHELLLPEISPQIILSSSTTTYDIDTVDIPIIDMQHLDL